MGGTQANVDSADLGETGGIVIPAQGTEPAQEKTLDVREIPCSSIRIGERHRKDMGDLSALAASIAKQGLLQPIGINDENLLVFGDRRLRAIRDVLRRETILARVVHVTSIVAGEHDENELRKNFTPSERVAIADAIHEEMPERRGGNSETNPHNYAEWKGTETRTIAAQKAGLGSQFTYDQARRVIGNGTPELVAAMDAGTLSISAAARIATLAKDRQAEVLALPADQRREVVRGIDIARRSGTKPGAKPQPQATPAPVANERPTAGPAKRKAVFSLGAKQRLSDTLAQVQGICQGLSRLDIDLVRDACAPQEMKVWARIAQNAARELGKFGKSMTTTKENKQ